VYTVTSEPAASAPFQGPPPRSTRPEPSAGTDSFGALVDSSTAADIANDRANSTAQEQSASRRRTDDASAAADTRQSRNAASADRAARNDSNDRDAAARQRSDANTDANADAAQRSKVKSSGSKTDDTKSTAKPSSDDGSAADTKADPATPAQQDEPAATTPNPVAVAVPIAVASTTVPAASPSTGKATTPLAIAAAAIAATSAAVDAPAASATQTKIDSSAAAVTASAAASATTADAAATAKNNVQAAASETVVAFVSQPTTQTNATAATGAELTAAVAATAPVAPKATSKTAGVVQAGATASSDPDTAPGTVDPTATAVSTASANNNVVQQPAGTAKHKAENGLVDAAKADGSAGSSSTSAAAVAAHQHSAIAEAGQTLTDSSDTGVPAPGAIQPQLHSAAATSAAVGPLSVTAATNAAVPLSGLALEIAVSAKSGKSRFEIRLDPADLGRIDVRIDVDRNGQVTSHLTVEKAETLSMLRQDAPQLQRALDDAGLQTGNGGLQFSLRDQSSSGQDDGSGSGRNAHRLIVEEDTIPAAVAGRTYGRMLGSSSGVDIKV
jgi:flagellar hook-length control protein FliK